MARGLNSFDVIGSKEVMSKLASLSPKQMKRAYINAMKASMKIIEKEALSLVKSDLPNVANATYTKNGKNRKWTKDIVTYSDYSDSEGDFIGKTWSKPKGMLKWFIKETKAGSKGLRKTRKGYNRGVIADSKTSIFMEQAKRNKGAEASKSLEDNINKAIQYQWNKFHK